MRESDITYAAVAPLLKESHQEGNALHCTFLCPATFDEVRSEVPLVRSGILGRAFESTRRHLPRALRWGIWRGALRRFGYGFLGEFTGNLLGDVARDVVKDKVDAQAQVYSDDEKEAAVVEAFKRVASRFVRDGDRWVSARTTREMATDFSRQLQREPVKERFDLTVLARMLLEISRSDRRVEQKETDFIHAFLMPRMGDKLAPLERYPALRSVELEQVSHRETVLMLAWALALTDIELDPGEQYLLDRYTDWMNISPTRAAELRRYAELHLVDEAVEQAFLEGGIEPEERDGIHQLGRRLGLNTRDVDRVLVAHQRRTGAI